ncbi:hypothetical protein [Microvirga puerhi]|uniref:Exosortase/archaeosortase family protein n=1 Tax=Microvirga puerhi TaxID=2876078 RepID=A0ABS7VK21_9HYPH|nr:hypothetical protein [Microvirga puerhi]MBZ6075875.1 hypothetical protein [Microvirga puerhi]
MTADPLDRSLGTVEAARSATGVAARERPVGQLVGALSGISRNVLFAGLAAIGFANGISEKVTGSILDSGAFAALLNTFNISAVVWVACFISIRFLLQDNQPLTRRLDRIVGVCVSLAFLAPIIPLSWLALSALAIYLIWTSDRSSPLNRGAWILLGITVPMFWSRLLFATLSDTILQGDAALVGWLVGTHRLGNAVEFADGSGYLWIAPACSSLANVSLAILCWVTIAKVWDRPYSARNLVWVLLACSAVVTINVTRISLIGFYPHYFDLLHGPIGATVASWIILGVTVGICLLGVRHDHNAARA